MCYTVVRIRHGQSERRRTLFSGRLPVTVALFCAASSDSSFSNHPQYNWLRGCHGGLQNPPNNLCTAYIHIWWLIRSSIRSSLSAWHLVGSQQYRSSTIFGFQKVLSCRCSENVAHHLHTTVGFPRLYGLTQIVITRA